MENNQTPAIRYTDLVYAGHETFSVLQFTPEMLQYSEGNLSLTLSYRERESLYELTKGVYKENILLYNGTDYFLAFRNGFRVDYSHPDSSGGVTFFWKQAIVATDKITTYVPATRQQVDAYLKKWADQWGLAGHDDDVNATPVEMSADAERIIEFKKKEFAEILAYAQQVGLMTNFKLAARLRKTESFAARITKLEKKLKKLTTPKKMSDEDVEYAANRIFAETMRYPSRR